MISSQQFTQRLNRQRWFRDHDGVLATTKHRNDVIKIDIDWTDELGTDTISSVSYADNGLTTTSRANTTTTTSCNATGAGDTEITLNLTNSRKIVRRLRAYVPDVSVGSDYGR